MRLVEDYRVRWDASVLSLTVPLFIYYIVFKEHIYNLVAGGFIFMYATVIMTFFTRYYKGIIGYLVSKKMGYTPKFLWNQLNPSLIPMGKVSSSDMRCLEFLEILGVILTASLFLLVAYFIKGDAYYTQVFLGSWILNFMVFRQNILYIMKSFQYPRSTIVYTHQSIKIYLSE